MSSVPPARSSRLVAAADTPTALAAQLVHRPDIEGLRGIAVLSVLAVHCFPAWVHGGFVGVDIFFVLSGFLITTILLRSLEAGRFTYRDFYAQRIKRIFPALCLVLSACLLFSALFTFPSDSRQIGWHVGAGALFVSNFALWTEAGYFDSASETKPLLHLWSLGIEEQFYVVWPLALSLCFKYRWRALPLIGASLLASFALNVFFVADRPTATFFLPATRFWELMIGALLAGLQRRQIESPGAWLTHRFPSLSRLRCRVPDILAFTGTAMLAIALLLIERTQLFPGWWALLPTTGTCMLLAAGPNAWVNRHVLAQPILRFYGTISYPLYLWHWPLLSFPLLLGIALTNEVRVMILIASVVLAALTYELLEKPVRFGSRAPRTPVALCVVLAAIGACGWILNQTDGLIETYPHSVRSLARAEFGARYEEYRMGTCLLRLEQGPEGFADSCVERREIGQRQVFLWGDSHAASLYPGLKSLLDDDHAGPRLAQFTASRCPPLLSVAAQLSRQCERVNAFVLDRIAAQRPATVVLAGYWSLYGRDSAQVNVNMASLRETVRHLRAMGVQRVVVFGHMPTWTIGQPRVALKEWARSRTVPQRSDDYLDRDSLTMDSVVERALAGTGAVFVSPIAQLCNRSGCLVSTQRHGEFQAVMFDESHLTATGSQYLIRASAAMLLPADGAADAVPLR